MSVLLDHQRLHGERLSGSGSGGSRISSSAASSAAVVAASSTREGLGGGGGGGCGGAAEGRGDEASVNEGELVHVTGGAEGEGVVGEPVEGGRERGDAGRRGGGMGRGADPEALKVSEGSWVHEAGCARRLGGTGKKLLRRQEAGDSVKAAARGARRLGGTEPVAFGGKDGSGRSASGAGGEEQRSAGQVGVSGVGNGRLLLTAQVGGSAVRGGCGSGGKC